MIDVKTYLYTRWSTTIVRTLSAYLFLPGFGENRRSELNPGIGVPCTPLWAAFSSDYRGGHQIGVTKILNRPVTF